MLGSKFKPFFGAFSEHVFRGKNYLEQVDQLPAQQFVIDEKGVESRLETVYLRAETDDALRERLQDYLVEQEVKGFDPDVSNDEVLSHFQSKYESRESILRLVESRLADWRDSLPVKDVSVEKNVD